MSNISSPAYDELQHGNHAQELASHLQLEPSLKLLVRSGYYKTEDQEMAAVKDDAIWIKGLITVSF